MFKLQLSPSLPNMKFQIFEEGLALSRTNYVNDFHIKDKWSSSLKVICSMTYWKIFGWLRVFFVGQLILATLIVMMRRFCIC